VINYIVDLFTKPNYQLSWLDEIVLTLLIFGGLFILIFTFLAVYELIKNIINKIKK